MKNKSFRRIPYYLFRQRILSADPQVVTRSATPYPKLEMGKGLFENILRWEDDGGGGIVDEFASTIEAYHIQPSDRDQSIPLSLSQKRETQ